MYFHGKMDLTEPIRSGLQVHALQEPTVQVRESRPARHRQDAGATSAAPQSVKQRHDNLIGADLTMYFHGKVPQHLPQDSVVSGPCGTGPFFFFRVSRRLVMLPSMHAYSKCSGYSDWQRAVLSSGSHTGCSMSKATHSTKRVPSILVVDDEPSMREFLSILLEKDGYTVHTAAGGRQALSLLGKQAIDLVITDIQMEDMDGLELIAQVQATNPHCGLLAITAYGSSQIGLDAMKLGAYDYVTKPFQVDEIRIIVIKALENIKLRTGNANLKTELASRSHLYDIVGTSDAMQQVYQIITRVADLDSTVLLTGESGTGKELVARAIHFWGRRRSEPFVSVNCGALPETLLESELFGHQKGAFTGAFRQKPGLLEAADGGTFFLDEIGDTPPLIQVKLLQALQTKRFKRVGGEAELSVDVRFIAATNRDLHNLVREGQFREDLYYRLNVIPVHLAPLRDRREDIPLLVGHFLKRYAEKCKTHPKTVSPTALERLLRHDWPGNARELENTIERAVALTAGDVLDIPSLSLIHNSPHAMTLPVPELGDTPFNLEEYLASIEKKLIRQALEKSYGKKTQAAKLLGLTFRSLRYRIEKLGI